MICEWPFGVTLSFACTDDLQRVEGGGERPGRVLHGVPVEGDGMDRDVKGGGGGIRSGRRGVHEGVPRPPPDAGPKGQPTLL